MCLSPIRAPSVIVSGMHPSCQGWWIQQVALGAAIALLALTPTDEKTTLRDVAATYYANVSAIAKVTGRDTTMDYYDRLLTDLDEEDSTPPPNYDATLYYGTLHETVRLDLSLATQLIQQSYQPMSAIRGLDETLVRASADGTMQPVAVYVPPTYVSGRPAPLVVFLHGLGGTETGLLSPRFLHDLADRSGAIVIAPYARADFDYTGSESDVYDALDAAKSAFTIDARKQYLAGFSMGGFAVYRIAPMKPHEWAGVMSISGSLLGPESGRAARELHATPVYVVTGKLDDTVPSRLSTAAAAYLRDSGVPVSYYIEPTGIHRLSSLLPMLTQAWNDMMAGVVRPSQYSSDAMLPQSLR
jgi:predicted esterase